MITRAQTKLFLIFDFFLPKNGRLSKVCYPINSPFTGQCGLSINNNHIHRLSRELTTKSGMTNEHSTADQEVNHCKSREIFPMLSWATYFKTICIQNWNSFPNEATILFATSYE